MSANLIALQNRFLGQGETVYDRLARLEKEKGALSSEDLLALAKEMNLPPAHVRSVAKFYDDLERETPSKRTLRVCNGESCASKGAAACRDLPVLLRCRKERRERRGGGGCVRARDPIALR